MCDTATDTNFCEAHKKQETADNVSDLVARFFKIAVGRVARPCEVLAANTMDYGPMSVGVPLHRAVAESVGQRACTTVWRTY